MKVVEEVVQKVEKVSKKPAVMDVVEKIGNVSKKPAAMEVETAPAEAAGVAPEVAGPALEGTYVKG